MYKYTTFTYQSLCLTKQFTKNLNNRITNNNLVKINNIRYN